MQSNELGRNFAVTPRMTMHGQRASSGLLPSRFLSLSLPLPQSGILMRSRCSASPGWESRRTRVHRPRELSNGRKPANRNQFLPDRERPVSSRSSLSLFLSSFLLLFFLVDPATARAEVLQGRVTCWNQHTWPGRSFRESAFRRKLPRDPCFAVIAPLALFLFFFFLPRYHTTLRIMCSASFFFPSSQSHRSVTRGDP